MNLSNLNATVAAMLADNAPDDIRAHTEGIARACAGIATHFADNHKSGAQTPIVRRLSVDSVRSLLTGTTARSQWDTMPFDPNTELFTYLQSVLLILYGLQLSFNDLFPKSEMLVLNHAELYENPTRAFKVSMGNLLQSAESANIPEFVKRA